MFIRPLWGGDLPKIGRDKNSLARMPCQNPSLHTKHGLVVNEDEAVKVIVCGDRDFSDRELLFRELGRFDSTGGSTR